VAVLYFLNFLNVGFLISFGVAGLLTLNQLRTYLYTLQQLKQNELTLIANQVQSKKEESQATLPMDSLNTTSINDYLQRTQTVNMDDYEVVTPRRSF
tara:strand:- start:1855 stop:2145 length:291 start_codon:yes stop_codon:yes gene_type:complete